MTYVKLSLLFLLVVFKAYASFLGPVDTIKNLPGYIELNPNNPFYYGPKTVKQKENSQDRRTPSEIISLFFKQDKIDTQKINELILTVKKRVESIRHYECIKRSKGDISKQEDCLKNKYDQKFLKKWQEDKYNIALTLVIKKLNKALALSSRITKENINHIQSQDFLENFFSAIEIIEAVKAEDEQRGHFSSSFLGLLKGKEILFSKNTLASGRMEASNLLIPKNHPKYSKQVFFSYDELIQYQNEGNDLSLLEPNDSGFWRKPKKSISSFETSHYDNLDEPYLEKLTSKSTLVQSLANQDSVINVLYKPHDLKGGQSPKFDVYIDGEKWKLKFLTNKQDINASDDPITKVLGFIWGSEVNVEPTVNNLAAALGFSVDPVYFKKKVRLYFEDEVYEENKFDEARISLIKKVTERFPKNTNAGSAFHKVKIDIEGKAYIELYSVSLESKSNEKSDINIGFFGRDALGKNLNRAHRAFYLFLAWIGDLDVKDENDKVKLIPYTKLDGSLDYKVAFSNSDMGGALGSGYPNIHNYPLVDKVKKDEQGNPQLIELNYPRLYTFTLKNAVNINDAKWIARRMAQLSFEQILNAFEAGGYPYEVSLYFTYVMTQKRNELIKALNMVGETFIDDGGRPFTIKLLKEDVKKDPRLKDYLLKDQFSENNQTLMDKNFEEWPRRWGISLNPLGRDTAHKTLARALKQDLARILISKAVGFGLRSIDITQRGFQFQNIRIFNELEGEPCHSNCFFEGLEVGASHFVPIRHLVLNEDDQSRIEYPYLLVDVFRLGIFVGDNGKALQSIVNLDSSIHRELGARLYKMYEFIKVRPVKKLSSYFTESMEIRKAPKLFFKTYKRDLIDNLQDNESLIMSSYLGKMVGMRLRPPQVGFASFRLGTEHIRLSRLLVKSDKKKINALWAQNKSHLYGLSLNFFDYILKLPFVEQSLVYKNTIQHQYIFSKDSDVEMSLLLNNTSTSHPESLPDYLKVDYQKSHSRQRESFLNLLFMGSSKTKTATNEEYENFKKDFLVRNKKFEIETEKFKLIDIVNATTEISSFALADSNNDFSVGLEVNVFHPRMLKPEFFKMLDKLKSVLPLKYLNLEESRSNIKHYMGKVNLSSKIYITKEGLEQFFAQDLKLKDFKLKYLKRSQLKDNFWRRYQKMRTLYHKIKLKPFDNIKMRSLKRISKFILDQGLRFGVLAELKSKSGPNLYFDHLLITSDLAAFPGDLEAVQTRSSTSELPPKEDLSKLEVFIKTIKAFFYDNIYEII